MKRYMIMLFSLLIVSSSIEAQEHFRGDKFGPRGRGKMEQLEKLKLIEELDLEEETSIRFFTRRKDHMENQRKFGSQREKILTEIWEIISDGSSEKSENLFNSKMEMVFEIESKMVVERKAFFNSLRDILTTEQIAKVLAFEGRFKREIWKTLMNKPPDIR